MPWKLQTAPAAEPVTTAEAKEHLRIEHADDDTYIGTLITAARKWCEEWLWRGLVTQTWDLTLEEFPDEWVELPMGALASITSVTYVDEAGASQTLSTSIYEADTANVPGRMRLKYDQDWPATRDQWNAVVIRYVVGTAAASVPEPVKQAVLLLVSQMYEHRTPEVVGTIVSQVQFAVEALLRPYRLARF